jgi:membrane protein
MNDQSTDNIHHELDSQPTLIERLQETWDRFIDWIWTAPDTEEHGILNALKAFLRIHFIVLREFQRDRITLRASALTFTIVLSLVPVLALGTAVLKGLGAGDQMRQAAYRFIDQIEGGPSVPTSVVDEQGAVDAEPSAASPIDGMEVVPEQIDEDSDSESLTAHLRRAVDQIFDYVGRTNFAALGAFGIVGLILAVLSVLGSIEQAINTIWQTSSGRPLGRKLMDYLALMILLPITINLALATEATLQSPKLLSQFQDIVPVVWLGRFLLSMLPTIAVVATFTILYRFIPNTNVKFLPAILGGLFGGIGWFVVQMFYIKLQIGVARYNAIYGSFATLPLLLMWIYIGWVVFLTGAEMAFAAQVWRRYNWYELALTPIARLTIAFDIIGAALSDFHHRKVTESASLARRLKHPLSTVNLVLQDLVAGGVIRIVDGNANCYVPAATEEEIKPVEIVDLVFGNTIPPSSSSSLANEVLDGARRALADKKIIIASSPPLSTNE